MKQKQILKYLQILAGLVFIVQCSSAFGAQTSLFPVGSQFPKFTLGAPDSPEAQKYLGLERNEPFTLSNIRAKIVLIEFLEAF